MNDKSSARLEEKIAIVTGGGQGIGRCEALLLAQQGARVVIADLGKTPGGEASAKQVATEIERAGGAALAAIEDISTARGAEAVVDAALKAFGRIDILINNAGSRGANPIDKLTEAQWDSVVDSHLKGTFLMMKYSVPTFKRQHAGVIVNTGSESGLGMICNSAYAAAKEGIVGLTRSVAREQGRFGIRCNLVRPRANINTGGGEWSREVFSKWLPLNKALGRYAVGERGSTAANRVALPEQVATFVVWLCTEAAANINGRSFFAGGEEVGLWSEPELVRHMVLPGNWTLDSLDEYAPSGMTGHLTNLFNIEDPLKTGD